ncbi:Integrase [Pseudomonas sp. IT-P100]|uniref:integrase n=1 Tax=Pseudomonas sp. IT-P100 TaxID=3026452 RepID=UPI0039E0E7AA
MNEYIATTVSPARIAAQPADVRDLECRERDALIVKALKVDGHWLILSRYSDDLWNLDGFTSNTPDSEECVDFRRVPLELRPVMKELMYRYLRRGLKGQKRPKGSTIRGYFKVTLPFLEYLTAFKIHSFSGITPAVCAAYVEFCKALTVSGCNTKPLSNSYLLKRLYAIEWLYELSQYSHDPIREHPWADSSALAISGLPGRGQEASRGIKTPLIPDDVFCILFENAYRAIESGKDLLNIRDALIGAVRAQKSRSASTLLRARTECLTSFGWEGGVEAFEVAFLRLRTACYIVLASISGCRNHELAYLQIGAHHRTEDYEGTIFHWMRSRSDKTDAGLHDWMIPDVGVRVLRLMERWAQPYQTMLANEIASRRRSNPLDPEIAKAQQHRRALFIGVDSKRGNRVRTLCHRRWNHWLSTFARECGVDWNLASHQFRRKFANYVAHSKFGDLRYLREHFAHWTMDMTLGYAIDESWSLRLDFELFNDIQSELADIKFSVVNTWLGNEPLAGGYGRAIHRWKRDPDNLAIFENHKTLVSSIAESTAIRSNGHAWCTADNDGCIGNTLDRSRCTDCNNAVIAQGHIGIYKRLYENLKELLACKDIGEGGRRRVLRDQARYRDLLVQLGYDPETKDE